MTFLEKAMEINEHIADEGTLIKGTCPFHFGLEEEFDCTSTFGKKCIDCWNREMPNTEPKDKKLKNEDDVLHSIAEENYNKGFEDGMSEGLTQGQNDAWKLARKLYDMKCDELEKIFDVSGGFYEVIRDFSPQEALAKLKAYEDSKIEVGDVVTYSGEKGMVLDLIPNKYVVLTHDSWVQEWYECDVEKTGRHIDLANILEQIGE